MRKLLLLFLTGFLFSGLMAQDFNFWTPVNEAAVGRDIFAASNSQRPPAYKIFQLNEGAFKQRLALAPKETAIPASRSTFIISFPMPDGSIEQFRIVDAPVMAPELAARYPGINSYAGKGITDPSSTIRFDVSMHGVHAVILSATKSAIYIDQLTDNYYRVVRRSDMTGTPNNFQCLTDAIAPPPTGRGNTIENADDGKLRTYRLAMISGAEFSNHFIPAPLPTLADSIAAVLAAQNSHMTRANAVYERDFGIRMVLVANNDLVIYFNPATDPIANPNSPSGTAMQTAIDNAIGSGNYDIGHTESKGSDNGNAGCIGCVCTAGFKGRGWTVYANPSLLEFFVIDYLTHEMGHQFGANHTFSFNLEGTGVNVEPGSGVTIMGYAGITGSTDVAPHSIELFSVKSIEQITNYIKTGGGSGCDVETNTGNTAPTVNAGADWTIPFSTPFKLTGTASDPDGGDVLTYNWEQIDNRTGAFPSIPVSTATNGPMFRTYLSYTIPERTFPSLQYILTGANGFQWEVLPSVGRPLNFRFIAKDNHTGGGNTKSDDMVVTVDGTTGPFLITSQNAATSYEAGSTQTVTWSVNGTTGAPINCANVKISYSTDGGQTFPTVLIASTANDGSESITIPLTITTTARIKVEAVGNIFFDINNANISVTPPPFGFSFGATTPATATCPAPATMNVTLPTISNGGFTNPITLSATAGVPAGTNITFGTNPVNPGSSSVVTLNNANTLAPGTYVVTISGTATGAPNQNANLTFTVNAGAGPAITTQPSNQTACVGTNATFSVVATGTYQWQLNTGSGWNDISGATSASYTVTGVTLTQNGYTYRCVVTGQCGSTNSNVVTLTVNALPAITAQPQSLNLCSGSAASFSVTATGAGLSYQWELSTNGGGTYTPITGATSATYNIASVAVTDNNNMYRCVVSGTCAPAATSSAATLLVSSSITVTTNPISQTVCEGTNLSFTVAAGGSGLSYQWEVSTNGGTSWNNIANGGVYSGATTPTLTITGVPPTFNTYRYRATVSNAACTPGVSTVATLTVNTFPVITAQPQNATICEGASQSFSVTATTGVGTLSYQWQLSVNGGTTWTNLAGATSSTFAQTAIPAGQNTYRFRVIVTAGCGSVTSNAAVLTVNTYPVISFTAPAVTCVSDPSFTLSAGPVGGVFSGPGVGGTTFNPSAAGVGPKTVTYTATNNGCQSSVGRVILVNECAERRLTLDQYPAIQVFPSPNNGRFSIRLNTDQYTKLNIKIFNSAGQMVVSQVANGLTYGSVIPLDITNQASGTYHLFLSNDENGSISTKGVSIIVYK